ncbi:MAG: hypothetical protein U1E45_24960 [Geminicoccaceae bacterium]
MGSFGHRIVFCSCLLVLASTADATAADRNRVAAGGHNAQVVELGRLLADRYRAAAEGEKGVCAVAFLPGPSQSYDIRLAVTNFGSQKLSFVILNSFKALRGASLLLDSIFYPTGPSGGSVQVLYPALNSGGPAVLKMSSFDNTDTIGFNIDPDKYNDANYSATVNDMNGTNVEAVFAGSLRCQATLQYDPGLKASYGLLRRTSP